MAIVDDLPYGGTCMLRGCDPKKMLVAVTEAADWSTRMAPHGFGGRGVAIDWSQMMAFKRTFTDVMPGRLEDSLKTLGADVLHGSARFVEPGVVQVGDRVIRARNVHIATGARPATLAIPGAEFLTTSTEFLELPTVPLRIIFVGGGFIAFEFAHIARRAGVAEVAIVQRSERPLGQFDPDIIDVQVARTRALGINIHLAASVEAIGRNGDAYSVEVATSRGRETLVCDLVVHAAGRVPNIDALDLEAAGVVAGVRGIQVTPFMRSVSNPNVFAVGDCADTGAPNLTPVSANEARIAAKNLLAGQDVRPMEYSPVPSVVFTLPPVARVGLGEAEARRQGLDFDVKFKKTDGWYSSMRVGEAYSAFKVLVENGSGRILGAHLIGPGAEEQINLFAMAMSAGLTANQLKGVTFAYPSYASDLAHMV